MRAKDNNGAWSDSSNVQTFTVYDFAGGNGTPASPYQIENACQLQGMQDNLSAHYELIDNIDASETENWNGEAGFDPIGDLNNRFTGTFDGNGYVIENLYINRPSTDYVGLFGFVGSGAVVENVGLVNENVSGNDKVGGLAGHSSGNINNCFSSSGSVSGSSDVGGLVGAEVYSGSVSNSFWDNEKCNVDTSDGGAAKCTENMKNVRTYTDTSWSDGLSSAWDFCGTPNDDSGTEDIWNMIDGSSYPHLTWESGWSCGAPHGPIYINGNDNFTPANGVVGGGGTENDPYIIGNWIISAENAHGIEIRNTTAYFVVGNCLVENGGGTNGIYFDNVVNGRIEKNTCDSNYRGIRLYRSDNNTLTNNTCGNNSDGIYLGDSSNNTLDNNTCENNKSNSISLDSLDNNTLSNNTCENNRSGIALDLSFNNTLSNNTCKNNDNYGIDLWDSNNNTLTNNTCENNDDYGINLYGSDNNILTNNTCGNNNGWGILLYYSDNNTLSNNTCKNNDNYGIDLWDSNNNILDNNTCGNNNDSGIGLWDSGNNTMTNNTCENNNWGIYLDPSSNNLIYHNNLINNDNQAYDDGTNT